MVTPRPTARISYPSGPPGAACGGLTVPALSRPQFPHLQGRGHGRWLRSCPQLEGNARVLQASGICVGLGGGGALGCSLDPGPEQSQVQASVALTPGREDVDKGPAVWRPGCGHQTALPLPYLSRGLGLANRAQPGWAGPGRAEPTRQPPCPCPPCGGSFWFPRSMLTGGESGPPRAQGTEKGASCGVRSPTPPHPSEPPMESSLSGLFQRWKTDAWQHQAQKSCPSLRATAGWPGTRVQNPAPRPWPSRPRPSVFSWHGPASPTLFACSLGSPGSPLLQGALPPSLCPTPRVPAPPARVRCLTPQLSAPIFGPPPLGLRRQRDLISPKSPWSLSDKSQALHSLSSGAHSPLRPWDSGLRTPIHPPPTFPPRAPGSP